MSVVYINESPLLLEILSIEHRGDADDADEAALARTPSSAHAHHAPLSAAALAHAVLRPGDVLTGRVVVHARESEPVVGISVALRAALFWGSAGLAAAAANSASNSSASVAPVNDVTAAREAAFGRADGETLLRSVLVLLGAHHMAPAARARQLPTERLVRGTHVFPFQLQLPEGPPSTVLPSFVVEQLGAKVVYSLSAILERRDDGASNLVRPLPADAALLARSVSPTPSLLTRAIAQSSPAYPRPQRDANSRPSLASSASTPTPTRNAVYAAPPIVVVVDDATSTFSSLPPLPPADGGVADAPGRFLVPAPPANDVPAEGQYATNLLPHDDQYGVVTDPTNLAAPSAKGERGYATVPASVVAAPARERPYHAVTPLLDPDAEDSELYVPIGSQRELHDIPSASTSASPTVNWSGTMSSTQGALPAVPKVAAAAAAAAGQRDSDKRDSMRVSETVVVAGGDGKLPQVFHPPKSPRLANPQPTHGISGAHIAASVLLLRCIGARLPTPPRDWQPASASSLKKRLFSRKAMRLEISLQRSAFVVGQTLNVTIGKRRARPALFQSAPVQASTLARLQKQARFSVVLCAATHPPRRAQCRTTRRPAS